MVTATTEKLTFTVEEAADLAGISRSLGYKLARSGELPGVLKLGRRLIVSRRVFVDYLNGADGFLLAPTSARPSGDGGQPPAPIPRNPEVEDG